MKKNDVLKKCEQNNVRFVHLQFLDFLGSIKSITLPFSRVRKAMEKNIWFDGSSLEGSIRTCESDMYLKPDTKTFALLPWEKKKEARMFCDVYLSDGTLFSGDPRQILKRQIQKAEHMGYEYRIAPELEFFLFPLDEKGKPVLTPHDQSGYFDSSGEHNEAIRSAIHDITHTMQREIEAIHHEVASGQHEIDFVPQDALIQADQIVTTQLALKAIAKKHHVQVTFMPKPLRGENGSGMHLHQSLWKKGKNIFHDPNGTYYSLSAEALHFIAGQLQYMPEMTAITNPTVNSYKRLVPGYEAPIYVAWGRMNRSALIRIPSFYADRTEASRCELRCPDASGNPYLIFAIILAAGLEGIEKKLTPPDPIDENIYTFTDKKAKRMRIKTIPDSLQKALKKMETSSFVKGVLGEYVFDTFIAAKWTENNAFQQYVSQWEIDRYF
jgi:glutamine synthetase